MSDHPQGRRLSDKIKAAWQHALDMGRDEIADRLSLLYEATIMQESERFPRRRRPEGDASAKKLAGPDDVRTADGPAEPGNDRTDAEKP